MQDIKYFPFVTLLQASGNDDANNEEKIDPKDTEEVEEEIIDESGAEEMDLFDDKN